MAMCAIINIYVYYVTFYYICKTIENSNFFEKGKMEISVKIQIFFRSRMMKQTSLLESSREI